MPSEADEVVIEPLPCRRAAAARYISKRDR
jgi:hypothetical protein